MRNFFPVACKAKLVLQHFIDADYFSFATLSDILESMELGYMEIANSHSHFTIDVLQSTSKALGRNGESLIVIVEYLYPYNLMYDI